MAPPTKSYDVNSGEDAVLTVPLTATQTEGIIFSPIDRNGTDEAWQTRDGCIVEISQEIEGEKRVEYMAIGGMTENADKSVTLTAADVSRNVSRTGSSLTGTGTGQKFNVGARVRLINHHYNYNQKLNTDRHDGMGSDIKLWFGGIGNYIRGVGDKLFIKDGENSEASLSEILAAAGVDTKVRVSSNDTTSGFLNGKAVAGPNIKFTENNDGGNETMTISGGPSTSSEKTISSGEITVTDSHHTVDTEGDGSSDDLLTINGGVANQIIYLRLENSGRIVNIKDGDGNINIPGGDITLSDPDEIFMFLYIGSAWQFIGSRGEKVGQMTIWHTDTAPVGSLLCYGQAVSRSTYSNLFDRIGTTFGSGDGSTTFNLPDMRGRFPLGQDDMGGSSANRVTDPAADSLGGTDGQQTVNLSHSHTTALDRETGVGNGGGLKGNSSTPAGSSSSLTDTDLMNPYITVNYIIKF